MKTLVKPENDTRRGLEFTTFCLRGVLLSKNAKKQHSILRCQRKPETGVVCQLVTSEKGLSTQSFRLIIFCLWPLVVSPCLARTTYAL